MPYDLFSAFGNNIRNKLILCLSDKSKNVSVLISNCGLSQSAVSQHLTKLKKSGLIEGRKEGKEVVYKLKYKKAAVISKMLISLNKEVI